MRGIKIYMEGGGSGRQRRGALRTGMEILMEDLKDAARKKALGWSLVCCGSREKTYRRFRNAVGDAGPGQTTILLVDAEEPVDEPMSPGAHLRKNDDWDLSLAPDNTIHLMVQVMETWIVADPKALTAYYGRDFGASHLPGRSNLEDEPKAQILRALKDATKGTTKGVYRKIEHAGDLLTRIDPAKVRNRCRYCRRLFEELGRIVEAA